MAKAGVVKIIIEVEGGSIQDNATQLILEKLTDIQASLTSVKQSEALQMADLSQLETDVAAQTTVVDSAVTLLGSLAQQIRDLSTDPQALAQLADSIEQNSTNLAAAVEANTPPVEPTP